MSRRPLRVAVAQPATVAGNVAVNAAAHAAFVRSADARLVVFPELSVTGYELAAPALAPDDPALAPLVDACREAGAVALAGAPIAGDDGAEHVGMLAVDGDGARIVYAKRNPGGDEVVRFQPGPAPVVFELDGWRLGLAICKDTGVSGHAAETAALGIDSYVAAVCEHERDADVQDERAQRVVRDHGIWVVIASFAGATGGGFDETAGRSAIWSPAGELAARAARDVGGHAVATLS